MVYSLLVWIVLGAVIGAIATKFVDLRGDSPILGLAAAVGGAILLGLVYRFSTGNAELWSIFGLVFALIGAAGGVAAFHLVRARSISRDRQTVRSSY
jgi:uncharacterized membrane protein YeaQ/YmgE (transglycosylase-associated protein family)